jgi:PST family polysaccharide transporter
MIRSHIDEYFRRYPRLRNIIENASWLAFDQIYRLVLALAVSAFVARYLGPEQFGLLSYAMAFVALVAAPVSLGLDEVLRRELVRDPEGRPTLVGTAIWLRLGAGAAAFFACAALVLASQPPGIERNLVLILLTAFFFQPAQTISIAFQSELKARGPATVLSIAYTAVSLFRLALVFSGAPLWTFALAIVIEPALSGAMLLWLYDKRFPHLLQLRWDKQLAVRLVSDSWPLLATTVAGALYMRIDQLLLKSLYGPEELGIYTAAVRLTEITPFVAVLLSSSLFPTLLRTRDLNPAEYLPRLQRYFDLNAGTAYLFAGALTITAPLLIPLLYGREFARADEVLMIHAWTAVFLYLGIARTQYLLAENLLLIGLFAGLAGVGINVLLNLLLIPIAGARGCALASVITNALSHVVLSLASKRTRRIGTMQLLALALPFRGLRAWRQSMWFR